VSARDLRAAIGVASGCAAYRSMPTEHSLVTTTGTDFGACRGPVGRRVHELFLVTFGADRDPEEILWVTTVFACEDAGLDRWHYVSGPGWVVGVDAVAMGRAVLGLSSYRPPEVTGSSRLARSLARRLEGTAHQVECARPEELNDLDTEDQNLIDAQIRAVLAGSAPTRDQRDPPSGPGNG